MADAGRRVRVRTAAKDERKALEHYQDLRRAGKISRAVVIAKMADGSVTVLGQMLTPHQIAELVTIAGAAMLHFEEARTKPGFEPHEEPERRGVHTGGKPRPRKITVDGAGNMLPPDGENMISCGECNHPRWYVLHDNFTDQPTRYACAHCGNEVEMTRIYHPEGRA